MVAELHRLRTLGTKLGTERPQLTKRNNNRRLSGYLAERAGFEPALRFPVNTLSRRAPSTTRPPLRLKHFRRGPFRRAGWGDASPLGVRTGIPAVGAVNQRIPFPAPEPSKQQARGSSSRSGGECQDTLFALPDRDAQPMLPEHPVGVCRKERRRCACRPARHRFRRTRLPQFQLRVSRLQPKQVDPI